MIAILLAAVSATALYLQVVDDDSAFSIYAVLAHIVLGLLLVVAGAVLYRRIRPIRHRLQLGSWIGLALASATGITLLATGVPNAGRIVLLVHILSAVAGVVLLAAIAARSGWKKEWRLVAATFVVGGIVLGLGRWASREDAAPAGEWPETDRFFPSPGQTASGAFLDVGTLNRSSTCGESGCHPDIYAQWQQSAHRFSSFNNPFYKRSVEYLLETSEPQAVRWCGSCHDPALLYTGRMVGRPEMETLEARAGLTCEICHGMVAIKDITGNGNYVLGAPVEYPFAESDGWMRRVNRMLLRVKPDRHRAAMLKPFHRKAEFCATCHKVSLDVPVNHYRWLRGQDEYDAWQHSGVSRNAVASFYSKEKQIRCQGCHMAPEASRDMGHDDGFVQGHFFPAANTGLPMVVDSTGALTEWIDRTSRFLRDRRMSVDIFGVIAGETLRAPLGESLAIPGGTEARWEVVVRTRNVGHEFPGGTIDSNEPWVELIALSADEEILASSGTVAMGGRLDSSAHPFVGALLDKHGEFIAKRNPHEWVTTLYRRTIPPGSAEVVHFRWRVPKQANGPITLIARLNYRKFNRPFTEFSLGPEAPDLPVVTLAADTVRIAVGSRGEITGSEAGPAASDPGVAGRFNDYGIGLLRQGNLQGARRAFEEVVRRDPSYPDGHVNEARVLLQESRFNEAMGRLEEAEKRGGDVHKIAYFRGVLAVREGRHADAIAAFETAKLGKPHDRELLKALGQAYYFARRPTDAQVALEAALSIDPEDAMAHYNLMLVHLLAGNRDGAARHRDLYLKYKPEETARSLTQMPRLRFPQASNEAETIHDHPLRTITASAGRAGS